MLSLLFPQEFLFRDAVQSVHYAVSLIKIDCSWHSIKHLTTLDIIKFTQSIQEQCIETVHVLICKIQWIQFQGYPAKNAKSEKGLKAHFSIVVGKAILFLTIFFCMYLQDWIGCFLNAVPKSWESLVALELPSGSWVIFWTKDCKKETTAFFCTNLSKTERTYIHGNVTWQGPKKKNLLIKKRHVTMTKNWKNLFIWNCHVTMTRKKRIKATVSGS